MVPALNVEGSYERLSRPDLLQPTHEDPVDRPRFEVIAFKCLQSFSPTRFC